jgi:hypothetical protein
MPPTIFGSHSAGMYGCGQEVNYNSYQLIAGNIEEAQIHLGGLSKIVNLRGGIQTLPRLLAFFLNL